MNLLNNLEQIMDIFSLHKAIKSFKKEDKGAAAIEFAIIFPLMLTLLFGTFEIGSAIDINKKIARATNTMGDLIAQTDDADIKKAKIDDILKIGRNSTEPYDKTFPTLTMTAVYTDNSGNSQVLWSRQLSDAGTYSKYASASTTVPSTIKTKDNTLIKVTTQINYRTPTSWIVSSALNGTVGQVSMEETYYFSPRTIQGKLTCSDCDK
jgi:Flp pilus assembly protein TadG